MMLMMMIAISEFINYFLIWINCETGDVPAKNCTDDTIQDCLREVQVPSLEADGLDAYCQLVRYLLAIFVSSVVKV